MIESISAQSLANFNVLALLIGLFIAVSFLVIVVWWFSKKERHGAKKALNRVTMLITVPREVERTQEEEAAPLRDFRELMSVGEQFFSSLSSLYRGDLRSRILGQDPIVFEMVSINNQIRFYVSSAKSQQALIEKQILSYYPDAHVEVLEKPNIFALQKGEVAAGTVKLTKRFTFPLKTYRNLEFDPLNAITNALSKMGEGANGAIQIVLEPTNEKWRYQSAIAAKAVAEGRSGQAYMSPAGRVTHGVFSSVGQAMGTTVGGAKSGEELKEKEREKKTDRLTPQQEELMKLFNEKGAKVGFKTVIRVVAAAPDKMSAQANRDNILSAFSQYTLPLGNSFRTIVKNELVLMTDYILRIFGKAPVMLLNTEELASIFHLPNRFTETPNILWLHAKLLPPPVNLPQDGVVVGKSVYRGEEQLVRINGEDRRRHLFMIGKTGTGKTTFFENMILQDITNGAGLCFIDPLGDSIESILQRIPKERAEDVILFDASDTEWPMGLNLLEYKNPEERDFLIQEVIAIFYKLFDPHQQGIVGPQWEHWARNAMLTLMANPQGGTLIEIPRLFTDDAFRQKAISYVNDPVVKAFWEQQLAKTADFHKSEMYNYFISKFGRFMTNDLMRNIIGQTKSSFDIRAVMDDGKILLINLAKGKIGEINSDLLGMILVSKIQVAAFGRADIPEEQRRDFYLYVDEFQNFTTDTFATILSEARKYHLCLNITNQYIAQLTEKIRDAVIGNAGTIVVYRIGAADAEFLAKEMPGVMASDMTNLDRFQMYVKLLVNLTPSKPFSMKGIKPEMEANGQLAEMIRQLSRWKYSRERLIVETEVGARTAEVPKLAVPTGGNGPISNL